MTTRTRTNPVQIYLSDDELEKLNSKLDGLGIQNRSNYLRKLLLNGYCLQLQMPELKEMVSLLRRCSNNLNQYAKMANATGSFYAKDIEELKEKLEMIWDGVQKILLETGKLT